MAMRRLAAGLVAIGLAFTAASAAAQDFLAQPGTMGARVAVGDRRVPLPPGDWALVGTDRSLRNAAAGGTLTDVSALYALWSGPRLVALLDVTTNEVPQTNGFMPSSACNRGEVLHRAVGTQAARSWDCLMVTHYGMTLGSNPDARWSRIFGAARDRGGMPPTMLSAEFRTGRGWHYLTYRVFLNPEEAGFPPALGGWRDNALHRDRADPPRLAHAERIRAWAESFQPLVIRGVEGGF
jgi:hypothetical protein